MRRPKGFEAVRQPIAAWLNAVVQTIHASSIMQHMQYRVHKTVIAYQDSWIDYRAGIGKLLCVHFIWHGRSTKRGRNQLRKQLNLRHQARVRLPVQPVHSRTEYRVNRVEILRINYRLRQQYVHHNDACE
jgi:hypothetical protein